jgi:hypothetical protein
MTQAVLFNLLVSIGSSVASWVVIYRFFGEKLFGHFLDIRLQRQKADYDVKLEGLKHEQSEKLEALKYEQSKDIETLRAEISHLTDRGKHSNEREYLALSAIWEKYVDLHYATHTAVASFIQYPDLNNATSAELDDFLAITELSDRQKENIRLANDKNKSFSRTIIGGYINSARRENYELNLQLAKNGIFIPKGLKQTFLEAEGMCAMAIAQRMAEQDGRGVGTGYDLEFLQKGTSTLENIQDSVRERLLLQYRAELRGYP